VIIRRETIIALRARHTAFRIAVAILYPQQPPPALAQPAIPIVEDGEQAQADWVEELRRRSEDEERRRRLGRRALAIVATLWLGFILVMLIHAILADAPASTPPPPPQGRPIQPAASE
jgi:hypothetical protein